MCVREEVQKGGAISDWASRLSCHYLAGITWQVESAPLRGHRRQSPRRGKPWAARSPSSWTRVRAATSSTVGARSGRGLAAAAALGPQGRRGLCYSIPDGGSDINVANSRRNGAAKLLLELSCCSKVLYALILNIGRVSYPFNSTSQIKRLRRRGRGASGAWRRQQRWGRKGGDAYAIPPRMTIPISRSKKIIKGFYP